MQLLGGTVSETIPPKIILTPKAVKSRYYGLSTPLAFSSGPPPAV